MVRPYNHAKGVHIHTHPSPLHPHAPYFQQISMLSNDFSVVLRPLWLNPNDSVAAVTLVNEALLSRHFLFFVAVMARYSWSIGEGFAVVFPNLRFDGDLPSSPNRMFRRQLPSESPLWNLGARIGHPLYTAFKCARVGWPNIGPAAAAPAGPVPTALQYANMHTQHTNMWIEMLHMHTLFRIVH